MRRTSRNGMSVAVSSALAERSRAFSPSRRLGFRAPESGNAGVPGGGRGEGPGARESAALGDMLRRGLRQGKGGGQIDSGSAARQPAWRRRDSSSTCSRRPGVVRQVLVLERVFFEIVELALRVAAGRFQRRPFRVAVARGAQGAAVEAPRASIPRRPPTSTGGPDRRATAGSSCLRVRARGPAGCTGRRGSGRDRRVPRVRPRTSPARRPPGSRTRSGTRVDSSNWSVLRHSPPCSFN